MAGRSGVLAATVCTLVALAGCSGGATTQGEAPRLGALLPAPQTMRAGETGESAYLFVEPSTRFYTYTRMDLEPVTLWAGPYAGLDSMSPASRTALANAVYSELHKVAEQLCEMVDKPGPATLIVNAALIDAASADATMVTISGTSADARLPDTLGKEPFEADAGAFVGRAVLQLVARDAKSGAVLWQAIDRRPADATTTTPHGSWRDIDLSLKSTAAKFGNWLVQIGACT
jgi:Protein of unknown function (DUF3313).